MNTLRVFGYGVNSHTILNQKTNEENCTSLFESCLVASDQQQQQLQRKYEDKIFKLCKKKTNNKKPQQRQRGRHKKSNYSTRPMQIISL